MINKKMKRELDLYFIDIKKQLICNSAEKKKLILDLKSNIAEFLEDNPESSYGDVIEHFGTPDDIVNGYISTLEGGDLSSKLKQTKKIRKVILIISLFIVLIFICLCIFAVFENHNFSKGHVEVSVNQSIITSK